MSFKRWQRMPLSGEDRTRRVQRGIDAIDPLADLAISARSW
jgi:hypothetical protein